MAQVRQKDQNGGILNLIAGYFWGWVFPHRSRIHTAYIGGDSLAPFWVPEMFGEERRGKSQNPFVIISNGCTDRDEQMRNGYKDQCPDPK